MNLTRIWNFSRVGVCQLHFVESDYEQGGTVLKGNIRIRRKFRSDSVPSVFPNIPKYLQKTFPKPRKTERVPPSVRQDKLKTKFIKSEMAGEFLLILLWNVFNDPECRQSYTKIFQNSPSHLAIMEQDQEVHQLYKDARSRQASISRLWKWTTTKLIRTSYQRTQQRPKYICMVWSGACCQEYLLQLC